MGPTSPGDLAAHPEGGGGRRGLPALLRLPPRLLCSHLAARGPSSQCGPPPGQARRQTEGDWLLRPRHIKVIGGLDIDIDIDIEMV